MRRVYIVLLSISLTGGAFSFANANTADLNLFKTTYPSSPAAIQSCTLCHTSAPATNPYGSAYLAKGRNKAASLTGIESVDSDGDTFSNIIEIRDGTFPGNASSKPAPPTVTVFTIPGTSTTLTVSITTFTATDNSGVAGYIVTESATAPAATAAGWSATAPAGYAFATTGAKTLYAWAKDKADLVSTSKSASTTITLPDTIAPTVSFSMPATSSSLTVSITCSATDNAGGTGVTGYMVKETSAVPLAGDAGWSGTAPSSYTFATAGAKTLHAWAKDGAGNVSTPAASASTTITLPDTLPPTVSFSMPATSSSLTVSIACSATDNVGGTGVTGYMVKETPAAPLAGDAGWSGTAPSIYTFATAGAKTLYAWAKDGAGNVSTPAASASTTITLPDTLPPTVSFSMPATSSSLTVSIACSATDNVGGTGVTGYMVKETPAAPLAGDAGWSGTAPSSYTFATAGAKTLHAWAKDGAGNVSTPAASASTTITLADATPPTVSFSMPATSSSLTVSIACSATDNVGGTGVTGYMVKETPAAPLAGDAGWSGTAPSSYTFATAGAKTLYAWAKDGAGNVSTPAASASTTITLPDTLPPTVSFSMPATSSSLTVSITCSATDNAGGTGVTGYMVKETSAAPLAGDAGWSGTAPSIYTFATAGAKTLYAWAKDGAGNVSTPAASASTTITLPDTLPPTVSFSMPATSSSLTVSIACSATDNVGGTGVTGYMVKETPAAPLAGDAGWSGTAPSIYTFATAGAKTLHAWAKDGAGNVSTPAASASTTITLPDTLPPTVSFSMPATSSSLTVSIACSATDNVGGTGVTGYMVKETPAAPLAGDAGWSGTAPSIYTFATAGAKTLHAWAKDGAGNVSTPAASASTTITLPDTLPPTVSFSMPATSSSLTVSIACSATDNVGGTGVTGYMVKETPAAPLAGDAGWSGTAPSIYTFATAGAKTLYAWAKDGAGNVSTPAASASTMITLPDTLPPTVSFSMPATSSSLTVSIACSATDNVGGTGVTGYMVKETPAAPLAGDAGWSGTAPSIYTFATAGAKTLHAWAKDGAGNVSTSAASASTTITLPDTLPPTVSFSMPATSSSLTVSIALSATDNAGGTGVTGYMVKETSAAPLAGDAGWSGTAPASYTFASAGAKTLYAWAKDGAGNVSASRNASVTITLPPPPPPTDAIAPTVTGFTIPAASSALTVSITTFTATDNVGVTGFRVTETAAAPAAGATGWSATPPTSYTFASAGAKTLYSWAKDAAGNVSTSRSASVTITLPPPPPPPPPPVPQEDMVVWADTWFKVTIRNEGFYVEGLGLSEDRHRVTGYLNITGWDPEGKVLNTTLHQYDEESGRWHSVSMPLHYASGSNLDFQVWSQVTGDTTFGFTARIRGRRSKGTLKSATFKTLGGYHVTTTEDNENGVSGWLKLTGRMVSESKVPVP